ncbi:MAG: dephospho-CoA kinase [Fusobacteriota bacterium]
MILGLTGGIATGKSTVTKMIDENYDVKIIDVDMIAKNITQKYEIIQKIKNDFGDRIINKKNGNINRKKLRKIVFSDEKKLQNLNNITHPAILDEVRNKIKKYKELKELIIVDMPLLFEVDFQSEVDKVLLVSCSKENQLKRLEKRDGISKKLAKNMIESQMSLEKKKKKSDYIINNNGTFEELFFEIKLIMEKIKNNI